MQLIRNFVLFCSDKILGMVCPGTLFFLILFPKKRKKGRERKAREGKGRDRGREGNKLQKY